MLDLGQLAEQFFLPGGEVPRGLDDDLDQLVAAAPAADVGHPPPLEPEHVAALGPLGDVQPVRAVEGGDLDLGAEGGLGEADRHLADQVVAAPLEERVLADHDLDPEVAPGRTGVARLALVAELEPHAALDARGDSTLSWATAATRPAPRQFGQGSVIRTPSPPQAGQVVATWKKPRDWTTWPWPPQ